MSNVWILGAGFSASLGGPLLKTLFSQHSLHRVRTAYCERDYPAIHDHLVTQAHWLYQWGQDFIGGRYPDFYADRFNLPAGRGLEDRPGEGLRVWENAEEFLEYLSLAQNQEGAQWRDLIRAAFRRQHPDPEIKHLYRDARRLLAAECMLFTENANPNSERWRPYVRWVEKLVLPGDIIISFNYDPVLEKLERHLNDTRPGYIKALLPKDAAALRTEVAQALGTVFWLKLHGSTDWLMDPHGRVLLDQDRSVLKDWDADPCMGIPGPGKADIVSKALAGLWEVAMEAITKRARVCFLGYRFPPTDSQARTRILEAMRGRHQEGHLRRATIVLGPRSDDSNRVEALVRRISGGDTIDVLPLYVEDAFTVLQPPV